ncbi:MAG TPA: hypothetical protein ENF70_07250, partial [Deltaproteobacteria bacterium]|nr:hypothetical protein [Deltaproteobacteria bacterium]
MPRRARVRIYSLFFGLILTLFLLIPATSHATTAPEYIDTGEGQLFSETVNGALQAHDTFANAHADYPDDPVINAYLALTRLLKLGLTDDSGALTDLLSKFGIRRSGDSLDTLGFEPDLIDGEHFTVPETAPSGETVRAFLADTLLPAINDSIEENLDTTLSGLSGWTADTDKHN